MNANRKKIWVPGAIPSPTEETITIQILKDEPVERKVPDRPLGLALIELPPESDPDSAAPTFKVVWANEYHRQRFPDLEGKVCYAHVNKFDQPCQWCPVRKTFKDGLIHLAFVASPVKEDFPNITYSQIISAPYAYDSGKVRQALEMIFDLKTEELMRSAQSVEHYTFGNRLGDLLQSAGSRAEAADLLLAGLLVRLGHEVDIAHAFFVSRGYQEIQEAEVVQHCKLLSADIPPNLKELMLELDRVSRLRGMVISRQVQTSIGKRLKSLFEEKERSFLPNQGWIPVRLGYRKTGILMPSIDEQTDCLLVLETQDPNYLIFDAVLSNTALLISAVRRVLAIRDREATYKVAYDNFQTKLRMFQEADDDLVELIPFALGKAHDLDIILDRQKRVVHTIQYTDWAKCGPDVQEKLSAVLEETTDELQWLHDTMRTIAELKKVRFEEVNIIDLVNESFELFGEKLRKERITVQPKKLRGNVRVLCDRGLLKQVFINLIDNSCKAFVGVKGRSKVIKVDVKGTETGAQILFRDNGKGIYQENITRIFERYFSTQPDGTGLGLYFVKKIIENIHSGKIKVRSVWGGYAEFRIFLPLVGPE